MQVKANLCSALSFYRFEKVDLTLLQGTTLRNLFAQLNIVTEEICVAIVNGKSGSYNQLLQDGDEITLFPFISGG